ncbi:hypothetical protein ACQJBY_035277 [Aegilops geniculata]
MEKLRWSAESSSQGAVRERFLMRLGAASPTLVALPVIDLSRGRDEVRQAVLHAGKELGFFQVINHGMPERTMREIEMACGDFFRLPTTDKATLCSEDTEQTNRLFSSTMYRCCTMVIGSTSSPYRERSSSTWATSWRSPPTGCFEAWSTGPWPTPSWGGPRWLPSSCRPWTVWWGLPRNSSARAGRRGTGVSRSATSCTSTRHSAHAKRVWRPYRSDHINHHEFMGMDTTNTGKRRRRHQPKATALWSYDNVLTTCVCHDMKS